MADAPAPERRRAPALVLPLVGMAIGFVGALVILFLINSGGGDAPEDRAYPDGWRGDFLRTVDEFDAALAETAPPADGEACRESAGSACNLRREDLRQALPDLIAFRDELLATDAPAAHADWLERYRVAVGLLASAWDAEFKALLEQDREAFLDAHERGRGASAEAISLRDELSALPESP